MLHWRIYYGDGTRWSDQDGPPEHAPPLNVQCIVVADHEHGRRVLHGFDFYYWHGGEPQGARELIDLLEALLFDQEGQVRAVKKGRLLRDSAFGHIFERAVSDPDFSPKTGWRSSEYPQEYKSVL